jgi:hypothetical protein
MVSESPVRLTVNAQAAELPVTFSHEQKVIDEVLGSIEARVQELTGVSDAGMANVCERIQLFERRAHLRQRIIAVCAPAVELVQESESVLEHALTEQTTTEIAASVLGAEPDQPVTTVSAIERRRAFIDELESTHDVEAIIALIEGYAGGPVYRLPNGTVTPVAALVSAFRDIATGSTRAATIADWAVAQAAQRCIAAYAETHQISLLAQKLPDAAVIASSVSPQALLEIARVLRSSASLAGDTHHSVLQIVTRIESWARTMARSEQTLSDPAALPSPPVIPQWMPRARALQEGVARVATSVESRIRASHKWQLITARQSIEGDHRARATVHAFAAGQRRTAVFE